MYVVYDGVDNDFYVVESEKDAKTKLKELIDISLDGEWMDGIERSFIAKIITTVDKKEIKAPDDYRLDSGISKWYEMEIKDV